MEPPARCDAVVVGAGILGLATARELLRRRPGAGVAVLEREDAVAGHQTGHNSGVVHAGVYYAPGSSKARLCVAGARALYAYCDERGIPAPRLGKLVVATEPRELPALRELHRRAVANGVAGIRLLHGAALEDVEPHVRGIAALHSPATGVVDYGRVAEALAADLAGAGHPVVTGCAVTGATRVGDEVTVRHTRGTTRATRVVFCAGAWADRLAVAMGGPEDPRILPFRGAYRRLRPEARDLVRGLVYPVPDPRLPFLGVHLTRHADGEVTVGPTALLVPARDAYRLRTIRPRDLAESLAWPGTWRLAWRFRDRALAELVRAARPGVVAADARRFVPALDAADLLPGPAGVRAQAVSRDGTLVDDFVFSATPGALHVRNAPSPAATAALAIAGAIVDRLDWHDGTTAQPER